MDPKQIDSATSVQFLWGKRKKISLLMILMGGAGGPICLLTQKIDHKLGLYMFSHLWRGQIDRAAIR